MSTLRVDNLSSTDSTYTVNIKDLSGSVLGMTAAGLRAYTGSATRVEVAIGGSTGFYNLNVNNITPVDNTGLVIVDAAGRAWEREVSDMLNIQWFGAVGDGVTDDSAAFNRALSALTYTQTLFMPLQYRLVSPATMSGRVNLLGSVATLIKANLAYTDLTFPVSADAPGVLTPASPFFSARGIIFEPIDTTKYALTLTAQAGHSFLDCATVSNCTFDGVFGMRAVNMLSVALESTRFYSTGIGVRTEGCTNWSVSTCWFRNAAQAGFYITGNPLATGRLGGENIRFVGCEFAGCTKGIYAFRHVWGVVMDCLFDYCMLPIELHGSYEFKIEGSYLGASQQGSNISNPVYVAPPVKGVALYVHGAAADAYGSASYGGTTSVNCEFVNYNAGTSLPVVYCEGYLDASNTYLIKQAIFVGCKFYQLATNTATTMLSISYPTTSYVAGCAFISPNLTTTMGAPYTASNAKSHTGSGNSAVECTQANVPVPLTFDTQVSAGIKGIVGVGVYLQTTGGTPVLGVNTANQPSFKNVTETTTATAGAAATPSGYAGYLTVDVNGTTRKIGFYAS